MPADRSTYGIRDRRGRTETRCWGLVAVVPVHPERPGPCDLLNREQYKIYQSVYTTHASDDPAVRHADAWRSAVVEAAS